MNEIPVSTQGIPLLGFGTWPLSAGEAERCVAMALEVGFRHVDTAQMYGNEREVGRAIKASGLKRDQVFVVTKMGLENVGRDRFEGALARSLEDLGVDAVDLLLIHWPPAEDVFDGVIEQLVAVKTKGQARRIGVSNFTIAMMRRAQKIAGGAIINNQVEFHPMLDQSRLKKEAEALGIGISAYCPLARGKVLNEPALLDMAKRLARPASQLVLRWIIQQGVAAIPMTTKRENAMSNLEAVKFQLAESDMAAITALTRQNRRLVSPAGWAPAWDV
jgi:diketogulonate reductase-like aldo/keto reductase